MNAKLEHRGRGLAGHVRLHVGEEHRLEVGRRRHRRHRLQRLAGIPRQPRSRARPRALGLRCRSSARRQLRLQPAVRQRRALRAGRVDREGRHRRRLAGERHLHLAARLPAHRHRRGHRRRARLLRHQPRGSRRGSKDGRPSITKWFNTAAFAQPAFGAFGTVGRNTLRGPGLNNLDLALFKNFVLPKDMRVQFRLESFNVFNHPQFLAPNTSVTSPQFGVIGSARPARINQIGLKFLF